MNSNNKTSDAIAKAILWTIAGSVVAFAVACAVIVTLAVT